MLLEAAADYKLCVDIYDHAVVPSVCWAQHATSCCVLIQLAHCWLLALMHAFILSLSGQAQVRVCVQGQCQCQASCLSPGGPPKLAPCHVPTAFSYLEAGLHK